MMSKPKSFSEKMLEIGSNVAKLTFVESFHRVPVTDNNDPANDNKILDLLLLTFLRGALQTLTDQAQWIELSQTIQYLYG